MPQRLVDLIARQRQWSEKTFGAGERTLGLTRHIKKELDEIRDEPASLEEWIDVILLALDGAWRCGNHSPERVASALIDKQHVNIYERSWKRPASEDEPAEHDRGAGVINMTEIRKLGEMVHRRGPYEPGLD